MSVEARYMSAVQAARMIGVNEKTIRLWIKQGSLLATHKAANKLAIPVKEVERIIAEREAERELNAVPSSRELAKQIERLREELNSAHEGSNEELKKWIATVEARLSRIEETLFSPGDADQAVLSVSRPSAKKKESRAQFPVDPLPEGALLLQEFAQQQGVPVNTAIRHAENGLEGELLEVSKRPRPGRPGQYTKFLTQEQQQKALDFWYRHSVLKQTT